MLSDDWLQSGFTKKASITLVPTLILLQTWVDLLGLPVGIGIDFEYADDIHFELTYKDWCMFLREQFGSDDITKLLPDLIAYIKKNDWQGLEKSLEQFGIKYNKICFS